MREGILTLASSQQTQTKFIYHTSHGEATFTLGVGVVRLCGKNLGMIGHFFGWVRKKFSRSAIFKRGVIRKFFET